MKRTIKVTLPSLTEERLLFRERTFKYYRNPDPYSWEGLSEISQERKFHKDDSIYDKSFQYLEETYGDIYKLAEAKLFVYKSMCELTDKEMMEFRKLPFVSAKQCKEFFEDTLYLDNPVGYFLQLGLTKKNLLAGRKRFRNWLKKLTQSKEHTQ